MSAVEQLEDIKTAPPRRDALLDGGLPEWQRLAYPLTAAATEVKPGQLAPLEMKPRVVDAKTVQDHIKAPGYQIVDARAAVFYDGVQAGGSNAAPHLKGHIVSAGNVPFTTVTGADFKLKPASDLCWLYPRGDFSRESPVPR